MGSPYTVFIDDDNHPMDLLSTYKLADFDDCASAVAACEEFVDKFLLSVDPAKSAPELLQAYREFGHSPFLKSPVPECEFSSWQYASQRSRELAGDLWSSKDDRCLQAFRYSLEGVSAAISERLKRLGEPRTFHNPESQEWILRLPDGTSLRLLQQGSQGPLAVTVILPRERVVTTVPSQRSLNDENDACRRFEALSGLLRDAPPQIVRDGLPSEVIGLDWLGLTEIPAELWQHRDVEVLSLTANWLAELPPQIGRFTKLQELELCGNRLTQLPPELFELHSLTHLTIRTNFLHRLPPEIGQLSNLQSLDLSANMLTELPPEIGELKSLRLLRLSKNRLETLPPQLWTLPKLSRLELDRNRLTQIPAAVGDMPNLAILWLHHNRLTRLPQELCRLTKVAPGGLSRGRDGRALPAPTAPGLTIEGNSLSDPPPPAATTKEILAHLQSRCKRRGFDPA